MKLHSLRPPVRRSAFTLLELLTVITIIGILMALILPAIFSVMSNARIAEVSVEFTKLDQALTTFKTKFGDYPPSNLIIPAAGGNWLPKDRANIRAIWPQFDFSTRGGLDSITPVPGGAHLSGAECLVFFLGGMEGGTTAAPILAGFSKNPLLPWTVSGNADGPFMEFNLSRISDVDGDNLYEYLDSLPGQTTPILYLSGAGSTMNRDNDAVADDFDVYGDAPRNFSTASRNMSFPYLQASGSPYGSDKFQLISPGEDTLYGTGGVYQEGEELGDRDLSGNGAIADVDRDSDGVYEASDYIEIRREEGDNITNFSGGTLN